MSDVALKLGVAPAVILGILVMEVFSDTSSHFSQIHLTPPYKGDGAVR